VVGAVAASGGGGAAGFSSAYLATGGIAVVLALVAFGLKSREAERNSVVKHETVEAQEV